MDKQIKEAIDSVATSFEEFKKTNDERIAKLAKGEAVGELEAKLARIEKGIQDGGDLQARLEKLELSAKRRIAFEGDVEGADADERNHMEKFISFLRDPKDQKARAEAEEARLQVKGVEVTTPGLGGYAVPQVLARQIEKRLLEISPIRSIVGVQRASSTDFKLLLDNGGTSSGWVGEKQARTETDTPGLSPIAPTFGTLYAYPKATEESMNDMFFDVAAWLSESVAEAFAYQENRAFLTGNGVNKPTGMLFNPPEEIGDYATAPARTAGVYEYIASGAAAGFPAAPDSADPLIDLIFRVAGPYRANGRFLMNRYTMSTVRKFKDSDGNYHWQPNLQMGQPSMLMGYPITEAEGADDIAANSFPVGFGDFKKGYLVADLVGLRVTPDEITTPGFVKWYFRKRLGGIVYNDDAVKWLKMEL